MAEIKSIKVFVPMPPLKLDYQDRAVYSMLAVKAHSAAEISKALGIHRTKTLPKILDRLLAQGLIYKASRKWKGWPPDPEKFRFAENKETNKPYPCYNRFLLKSKQCPLTNAQVAIYSYLCRNEGKTINQGGIAIYLGVS